MGVHLYTNGAWTDSGKIYRNSLNLFDKNNIRLDESFSLTPSPDFYPNPSLNCSNYLPVVAGKTYLRIYDAAAVGNIYYTFDSNFNFLSEQRPGVGIPFTISDNVSYIVFNFENTYELNKYMLAESTSVIPYEPYNVVDWYTNNGHGYSSGAWD